MGVGTATTKKRAVRSISSEEVKTISVLANASCASSPLGSMARRIFSKRSSFTSKPITEKRRAKANAKGKPTYPSPTTASFACLASNES